VIEIAKDNLFENNVSWSDLIKRPTSLADLSDIDMDYGLSSVLRSASNHHEHNMKIYESIAKAKVEKEAEELRRHDEKVAVGKEQVELLKEQVQKLTALLQSSQNSNEQRDAVIHFMVQMMMQMEASQKEKKKTLSGVLMQISSLVAIGADLSGIYEFVEGELEELAKED